MIDYLSIHYFLTFPSDFSLHLQFHITTSTLRYLRYMSPFARGWTWDWLAFSFASFTLLWGWGCNFLLLLYPKGRDGFFILRDGATFNSATLLLQLGRQGMHD